MNKPLKIFVINLARSADRREKMSAELAKQGLEFEFLDGVDGSLLSSEEIGSVYKASDAFDRLGRELHPNEIGCAWSHIKAYELMIRDGIDEAVILEDDIDLCDDFEEVLKSRHEWLPSDWRLVNFAHDMAVPLLLTPLGRQELAHLNVCRFDSVVGRTGAYLINKEGAESLLKHAYPIRIPADDLTGDALFLGAPIYGINPRVAVWNTEFQSAIWTDQTQEKFVIESRSGLIGLYRRLCSRFQKFMNRP